MRNELHRHAERNLYIESIKIGVKKNENLKGKKILQRFTKIMVLRVHSQKERKKNHQTYFILLGVTIPCFCIFVKFTLFEIQYIPFSFYYTMISTILFNTALGSWSARSARIHFWSSIQSKWPQVEFWS